MTCGGVGRSERELACSRRRMLNHTPSDGCYLATDESLLQRKLTVETDHHLVHSLFVSVGYPQCSIRDWPLLD